METQRIWITGASGGIGEAVALEYAAQRRHLALTARRADELERVASQCEKLGAASVVIAPADITDKTSVQGAIAEIVKAGPIDLAILNAGVWKRMPAQKFDADIVEWTYGVNVIGTSRCIEAVLPQMIERHTGRIAVVSSLTAFTGVPMAAAYGSSKSALMSMCESIRADLIDDNVAITTIYPGFVRTPMTAGNRFKMPGLIDADDAARRIVRGLNAGKAEISFPRKLSLSLYFLRVLPGWLRRPIAATATRRRNKKHRK